MHNYTCDFLIIRSFTILRTLPPTKWSFILICQEDAWQCAHLSNIVSEFLITETALSSDGWGSWLLVDGAGSPLKLWAPTSFYAELKCWKCICPLEKARILLDIMSATGQAPRLAICLVFQAKHYNLAQTSHKDIFKMLREAYNMIFNIWIILYVASRHEYHSYTKKVSIV